jgi:DNA-binding FadR family transcriptional regulator
LGATLVEAVMDITLEMRRSTFSTEPDLVGMHKDIHKALTARNPELARAAMTYHFDTMERVIGRLTRTRESNRLE